jgi:hypothetical protein
LGGKREIKSQSGNPVINPTRGRPAGVAGGCNSGKNISKIIYRNPPFIVLIHFQSGETMVTIHRFPVLLLLLIGMLVSSGCLSAHVAEKPEMPSTQTILNTTVTTVATPVPVISHKPINGSFITIDPIPDHYLGDTITFSGTTNLPAGNNITLVIGTTAFHGCQKMVPSCNPDTVNAVCCTGDGFHRPVTIVPGSSGINTWLFTVKTSEYDFIPDLYEVRIVSGKIVEQGFFKILEKPKPSGYWIFVDPIPAHNLGDNIVFQGTTNLPGGENITTQIFESDRHCSKCQYFINDSVDGCCGDRIQAPVIIKSGNDGINIWSKSVNTSYHNFREGRYSIFLIDPTQAVGNISDFNIY